MGTSPLRQCLWLDSSPYVHKWVADALRAGLWSQVFALSGCAVTVVASQRAQKASREAGHSFAQEEWSIETTALISLLLLWMNMGNESAGLLVHTLFRNTIASHGVDDLLQSLTGCEAFSKCPFEAQAGVCDHVRQSLQKAAAETLTLEEKYMLPLSPSAVPWSSIWPRVQLPRSCGLGS